MKNLKKVFALVLALSMILSTFTALTLTASAAAEPTFSDIAGTSYEDAVEVLSALGIVAGYEDGTFGGDKIVTRAEMAAFIVRELGLAATASSATGGAQFTDVPANHWAAGSIDVATRKKIIVGNGDGTFNPDATVTYEAAVKMLVCALGYDIVAQKQGGWPTGYLIQGAALGLTDGIDGIDGASDCNRGVVATLLFNALEVDLMEEVIYTGGTASSEATYKTLLFDNLKVTKYYDAEIVATPAQGATKTAAGSAKIAGSYDYYGNEGLYKNGLKVQIGETDPDAVFGSTVIVYCKDNGANVPPTMLCIVEDSTAQETAEIAVADFYGTNAVITPGKSNTEGENTSKHYTKLYYKTQEDTKAQYVRLLDTDQYANFCQLVINGTVQDEADWTKIDGLENGVIKLIDNKTFDIAESKNYTGSDGIYEKVIVDAYFDFVVSDVDTEENMILTVDGTEITLDENKKYAIVDSEGAEVKIEDLQENDVLSVYTDNFERAKVDDAEVLNIVVYNEPVEGTVTEKTSKAIYIDGTKYKVSGGLVKLEEYELEDTGIFYINAAGDIVYSDTTAAAKDYAVFYQVYQDGARKIIFNLVTSESETLELTAVSNIDIVKYESVEVGKDDQNNPIMAYKKQPVTEYKFSRDGDIAKAVADLSTTNADGVYTPYLASYSLKSGSETQIDTIYLAGVVTGTESKYDTRFAKWDVNVSASYNKNEATFGSYVLDSSTVIFDIPTSITEVEDADKIRVIGKDQLESNTTYNDVTVYEVDKNGIAKALVIRTEPGSVEWTKDLAVVVGLSKTKDAAGEDVYKLYMLQAGRLITKTTEDNEMIENFGTGTTADGYTDYSLDIAYSFYPGSVVMFEENVAGAVDTLVKIYPTTSYFGTANDEVPYYRSEYFTLYNGDVKQGNDNAECFVIYGKVIDKNPKTGFITIGTRVTEDRENWTVKSYPVKYEGANITVVNYLFEEEEEKVAAGTASDIKYDKNTADGDDSSYVLARKKYGATRDIIVFENFDPDVYVY